MSSQRHNRFLACLVSVLLASVLWSPVAYGQTQTIAPVPSFTSPPSNWDSLTQTHLLNEAARRAGHEQPFHGRVVTGGTASTAGVLTHTIAATTGYAGGYYVSQVATAKIYIASRRTFVYVYSRNDAVAGDFTITGGTTCSFDERLTHLIFIACNTASDEPRVTPTNSQYGLARLLRITTDAAAITAVDERAIRVIVDTETISASRTVGNTGIWVIQPGGRISRGAGTILTFGGTLVADPSQCIFTGTGTFELATDHRTPVLHTGWFCAFPGEAAATNTTAFQEAILALPARGGHAQVGPGNFDVSGTMTITANVNFLGAGDSDISDLHGVTTLINTTNSSAIIHINTGSNGNGSVQNMTLRGLTSIASQDLMTWTESSRALIRNVAILNAGRDGLNFRGQNSELDNVRLVGNARYGLHVQSPTGGANANKFTKIVSRVNVSTGVVHDGGEQNLFDTATIEDNSGQGFLHMQGRVRLLNTHFEGNTGVTVTVQAGFLTDFGSTYYGNTSPLIDVTAATAIYVGIGIQGDRDLFVRAIPDTVTNSPIMIGAIPIGGVSPGVRVNGVDYDMGDGGNYLGTLVGDTGFRTRAGASGASLNLTASASDWNLGGRDLGNNVQGPRYRAGRNTNAGAEGGAAGTVEFQKADGAVQSIWVDTGNLVRINALAPTGLAGAPTVPDTAGTVVGTQASSLAVKEVFGKFTDDAEALRTILGTPLFRFRYTSGAYNNENFVGIITDYSPVFGKDNNKSLNEVTLLGYLIAAVKAQQSEIEALKQKIGHE